MPKFKNGEVENLFGIAFGATVIGKHLFHRALFKIAAGHCLGIKKKTVNPVLEIVTKPSFIRNGEAGLFAIENFARQAASERLLGKVLSGETAEFEVLRQGGGEFEDFVIEQRDAKLDGIGHRHFVGFDEKIGREPGFCVDVEHSAERAGAVAIAEVFCSGVRREFLVDALEKIAGIELPPLAIEKARRM